MNDPTLELAQNEMKKYGLRGELVIEPGLPSFELRGRQGELVIAAPDSLELLYGVYDAAERFGGWCFFEPGRDRFDEKRIAPVEEGVLFPARRPLLKRRGFIQEFPFDSETRDLFDWMAKNKLNYLLVWMKYYDHLSDELKAYAQVRGIVIESGHHNFNYWIPGEKYAEAHPEFFAEIGGKRISPSIGKKELLLSEQLCTTNPELRREIVRNMLSYCEKHPEVKVISLIPNDGFGWCECENCSKFYDKSKRGDLYSLSEHVYKADRIYHDLLRDVSAQLRRVRPDISLSFCAYCNYGVPSPGFRLEKGMMVHAATYWRCINHTIDDPNCPFTAPYAENIRRWAEVKHGGEINIYEYYMGVNFYLMLPMIHFKEMFHEMKWYADNGVDGILTQFHVSHWSVYGMNYCLMARAARGEEEASSIDTLFEMLFGPDAEEAKAFYGRIKSMLKNMGRCHIPYPRSLFRRTKLADFRALEGPAQSLAAKAPRDRFRADLVIWTQYMTRFKELFDKAQEKRLTEEELQAFLDWIGSFEDTRVFVRDRIAMYFEALREDLRTGREWIHFNLDWEDAYIRRHDKLLG
ncbi:MAG: DUF4838 domain-containing protein [Lentisphaeria bacterium]|nr:DUF4838 domain-containing protein [Lentisphaeria bacterium]